MVAALALIAALHGSLDFVDDDYPKAVAMARAQHKPLFIDFWATWCHSCLSMQRFVLSDPGMKPLADQVVWASVETETEKNKPVVDKYPVDSWPTFLVVDPESEKVLGRWIGSSSVQELRAFVQDGIKTYRAKAMPDAPSQAQREGDALRISGDLAKASAAYGRAVQVSKPDDPQRPERLNLYIGSLLKQRTPAAMKQCVQLGLKEAKSQPETAVGSDFVSFAMNCAGRLPKNDPEVPKMRQAAIARLREILSKPDAPLAADDRSDALATLSEALDDSGRHDEALAAMRERAQVLEKAAAAAPDATMASTFDPHRVETYVYLGELPRAEELLVKREKEMPADYNPAARLARVLLKENKLPQAENAVDRALAKMDRGQRRVGILELKRDILKAEQKPVSDVLREELDVLRTLPNTQRQPQREAELEAQLKTASR
ncbi:MAG TPA: thioredoxin family protein [Myxococcales bacterium]|jgi:thiol-disulfide isomerase/thioredoxin